MITIKASEAIKLLDRRNDMEYEKTIAWLNKAIRITVDNGYAKFEDFIPKFELMQCVKDRITKDLTDAGFLDIRWNVGRNHKDVMKDLLSFTIKP